MERDQPHFAYGQVEAALAAVFAVGEAGQRGWLRGRLQHLRRLGLVAGSPGRGRVIDYEQRDVDRWLLALELAHFIDPVRIVDMLKKRRSGERAFARGEASLADLIDQARKSRAPETDVIVTVWFDSMLSAPEIGYTMVRGMLSFGFSLASELAPKRVSVFNLSARLRALDAALAEATKPRPPEPTGLAKRITDAGKKRRGEKVRSRRI